MAAAQPVMNRPRIGKPFAEVEGGDAVGDGVGEARRSWATVPSPTVPMTRATAAVKTTNRYRRAAQPINRVPGHRPRTRYWRGAWISATVDISALWWWWW